MKCSLSRNAPAEHKRQIMKETTRITNVKLDKITFLIICRSSEEKNQMTKYIQGILTTHSKANCLYVLLFLTHNNHIIYKRSKNRVGTQNSTVEKKRNINKNLIFQ